MPLLPEHEQYHKLGPKDVGFDKDKEGRVAELNIARTTSHTGEQLMISCPVYASDSRDELSARVQFCFSIIQDRMEDENVAMIELQNKARLRAANSEKAVLEKQAEAKKIKDELVEAKKAKKK